MPFEISSAISGCFRLNGIRKLISLPAQRECLKDRGLLKEGYFADITVFNPATIQDRATYENPTQQ